MKFLVISFLLVGFVFSSEIDSMRAPLTSTSTQVEVKELKDDNKDQVLSDLSVKRERLRKHLREKLKNLSEEEKVELRERMKSQMQELRKERESHKTQDLKIQDRKRLRDRNQGELLRKRKHKRPN